MAPPARETFIQAALTGAAGVLTAIFAFWAWEASASPLTLDGDFDVPSATAPASAPAERDVDRKGIEHRDGRGRAGYAITFRNLHTGEVMGFEEDASPRAENDLAHVRLLMNPRRVADFLRCRVTGDTHRMDPTPIRVAASIAETFEAREVLVVSGYRSARFNEQLRKKGHEVARRSQHILGRALDFRIPGVPARLVRERAEAIHVGGIGYYADSDFVHVDTGPNRRWRGR